MTALAYTEIGAILPWLTADQRLRTRENDGDQAPLRAPGDRACVRVGRHGDRRIACAGPGCLDPADAARPAQRLSATDAEGPGRPSDPEARRSVAELLAEGRRREDAFAGGLQGQPDPDDRLPVQPLPGLAGL